VLVRGRILLLLAVATSSLACSKDDQPGRIDEPAESASDTAVELSPGELARLEELKASCLQGTCVEFERRTLAHCRDGHARSCGALAVLIYLEGRDGRSDPARATELLERSCDLGDPWGCQDLAALLSGEAPLSAPRLDPERARRLSAASCAHDLPLACENLALALRDGLGGPVDHPLAARYFARACDNGRALSCQYLGVMLGAGDRVGADPVRARELFERGCDLGLAVACANLAVMASNGDGGPRDHELAARATRSACQLGYQPSCAADLDAGR
jgi:uncharacterized protein